MPGVALGLIQRCGQGHEIEETHVAAGLGVGEVAHDRSAFYLAEDQLLAADFHRFVVHRQALDEPGGGVTTHKEVEHLVGQFVEEVVKSRSLVM